MILYRYLSEEYALKALQERKLKVSRILELNDPFDCHPAIYDGEKVIDVFAEPPPTIKKIWKNMGVVCYSKSIEDPVVWSHYADKHRGIALGFEFPPGSVREVNYESNKRFPIFYEKLPDEYLSPETAMEEGILEAFLFKAKSWIYEQEYRYFIKLSKCTMHGSNYFQVLPMESLRRVVLGQKSTCAPEDIKRLLCPMDVDPRKHFSEVEIYKSRLDNEFYKINPELVKSVDFELE